MENKYEIIFKEMDKNSDDIEAVIIDSKEMDEVNELRRIIMDIKEDNSYCFTTT